MAARVLAVLFADVSGSTALYETLGDRPALQAVEAVLQELRAAAQESGGRVVKTLGDEIMAVFPSAAAAAQCACAMQARVAALQQSGRSRLGVQVGFHVGPVLEEGGDVFGDAVNTAARMVAASKSGQIVATADSVARLPPPLRARTRDLDRITVRGKRAALRIFEVLWRDDEDLTVLGALDNLLAPGPRELRLRHAKQTLRMGPDRPTVLIGRDAASDIVIAQQRASRLHGRIERRGEQYFYADLSTNGTYVTVAGDLEIRLRHEEIMLHGRGRLAYGFPATDARAEIVHFEPA